MKRYLSLLTLCLMFVFPSSRGVALEGPYDYSDWDRFLKIVVTNDGQTNYQLARENLAMLEGYLSRIEQIALRDYEGWPREEKLAFWLNAYHAGLVREILNHYPIKSVQDIPGLWDKTVMHFGKQGYSLNQMRRGNLIGAFGDEKIHLALSCGARSCPKMRNEAFTGPHVEGQLFLAAREFVNDDQRNQIIPGEKKIKLSRIFKWYAKDFILDFGRAENNLGLSPQEAAALSFVAYYLQDIDKLRYLEEAKYKVKYEKFNWELNDSSDV
jgi:hypothetical protein